MRYELFISLRYLKAKQSRFYFHHHPPFPWQGWGLIALIIVLCLSGFEEDLKKKILGTNAHLVVLQQGAGMRDYPEILKKVEEAKGVVAATPFIFTQAMLTSENNVHGIVLRGIDPATAGKVINIENTLKKGSMAGLQTDDAAAQPGIFIGKELAQTLGVMLDDSVVLVSPMGALAPMGGGPPMKKFRIAGIFDSGMYGTHFAGLHSQKNAQSSWPWGPVSGLEVKVDDIYAVKSEPHPRIWAFFWTKDWCK
jgi:lipoprotein-releasing system permease protein